MTIVYYKLVSLMVSTDPFELSLQDLSPSHSLTVKMFPGQLRIVLVYDPRSTYLELGYSEVDCKDLSLDEEMPAISAALEHLGHHVTLVPGIKPLVQQLAIGKATEWDLVFNVTEGFYGSSRESQVPGLLEAYQIPYTFSDAATLALCLDKGRTKVFIIRVNSLLKL